MSPKVEGVYRLSPRGMVIVEKYGYGSVMDTLLGLDRDVETLKSVLKPPTYIFRRGEPGVTIDDPAFSG